MHAENALGPEVDSMLAELPPPRWRQRSAAGEAVAAVDLPLDLEDAADAAPPLPPQHEDALWALARRTQGVALRLDFELHTPVARQAFRRDFVFVSRQSLGLDASRRVQGLDRALLDAALSAVAQRADAVQALFARIDGELEAALAALGQADARIASARPTRFRATVVSPGARRFIELLQGADRALCQVERAWLLGALAPAVRTGLVGDCRRALTGFKQALGERRHAVGAQVRAVNAPRPADAPRAPAAHLDEP